MFVARLLGSPLKVMAFLTTAVGLLAILTFSYFSFLGIYLLGKGLLLYGDWGIIRLQSYLDRQQFYKYPRADFRDKGIRISCACRKPYQGIPL